MRSYAKISTSIWHSRKFKALRNNDRARILYFYFHTCPMVNSCGCFNAPVGYIVSDLAWGEVQILQAIDSLSEVRLIDWNANEEVVRIVGFLQHDPPTNPKHAGAVINVALDVPDCREKCVTLNDLLQNKHCVGNERLQAEWQRLSKAYPDPIETPFPCPLPLSHNPTSLRSVVAAKAARRTKLPDDWPTQADREKAVAYWLGAGRPDLVEKLENEVAKARANHRGKGTRAVEWDQVWVTWYSRTLEYTPTPRNAPATAQILKVV